ncbi:MAG: FtsX-like permease family protein [Firmicutes bacterium]|nr:FtsX-like permease family protein [Bacillota bacterium]
MNSLDLASMGLKNLFRRKARTILTVLGVIIGTAAIVVMVSLGLGMNKAFEQQLQEYGSLTMIDIYANMYMGEGPVSGGSTEGQVYLDDDTIATIEAMENVEFVIGFKRFDSKIYAGKYESYTSIKAVDFDKLALMDIKLSEGVMPTKEGKNEVLMGFYSKQNFYDPKSRNPYANPPVIDVFNTKLEMLPTSQYYEGRRPKGFVLTPTGITSELDYAYSWDVFMDYDTFVELKKDFDRKNPPQDGNNGNGGNVNGGKGNSGNTKENKYDEMKVSVTDIKYVQEVQEQIKALGYEAYSLTDALENMKKTSGLIQAILGGIGAVSLFVAAIGITNTMVMSIYERTKEIGVMKVIGAQLKDIKRLFLFEAAMIGLFGGVLGIGISYGISAIINTVLSGMNGDTGYYGPQLLSDIPAWLAISGMSFSTVIGLIAGYYPAVRATKLSALEAIRTE